jgi:hypothetical protein
VSHDFPDAEKDPVGAQSCESLPPFGSILALRQRGGTPNSLLVDMFFDL